MNNTCFINLNDVYILSFPKMYENFNKFEQFLEELIPKPHNKKM